MIDKGSLIKVASQWFMWFTIFAIIVLISTFLELKFLDKNFFKKQEFIDGGMGQELLNRGVKPRGTLWGAPSALYKRRYHKIVVKTHLDFIKAGARNYSDVHTFGSRKRRLIENGLVKEYKNLVNTQARYSLAKKAVRQSQI